MENKEEVKIQSTSILSSGYGLIPKVITRDKELTMEAKAIYAYLASFAGSCGHCYPSKELMLSELGTTERRFNKNMNLLKEHGYVKVHKRRKGNRNDSNLYELLMDLRDIEKIKNEFDTSQFDSGQFDSGQFDSVQIDPPNINSININSINNNSKKNKHTNKESKLAIKAFAKLYEENIGLINGISAEYLTELSDTIDVNLFKRAIEISTDRGKCNLGYIKGIINRWLNLNIKTLDQLEAYKLQQDQLRPQQKDVKSDVRRREGITETESTVDDREDEARRRAELLRIIEEEDY